ncbi:MAG: DUF1540 domain-containing protein [Oscillospiraceae bacterium]|nr:DUF1540 domain-containing protein [Oscillospiraceae bacterium]
MKENKNSCECIDGIRCKVENCVYNKEGCQCTASEITVGPAHACTSSDTVCATFKPSKK